MAQELWQRVVREVVRRLCHRAGDGNRQLVAFFCGGWIGLPAALEQMQLLRLQGWSIRTVLSPAAESVIGEDAIRYELAPSAVYTASSPLPLEVLEKMEVAVVPVLTMNSAAKVCLGVMDTPVVQGVADALMMGKPVVAACNAANPHDAERSVWGLGNSPVAWKRLKEEQVLQLPELGVRLVDAAYLGQEIRQVTADRGNPGKKVPDEVVLQRVAGPLTRLQVVEAWQEGVQILEVGNGPVSPLAREAAAQLGLEVRERQQ